MVSFFAFALVAASIPALANACTGISLTAKDNSVVAARTNEWGKDYQNTRIHLLPRGHEYVSRTPKGSGKKWTGKHGIMTTGAYGQPYGPDAMNEVGLYCAMFMMGPDMSAKGIDQIDLSKGLSVGDFQQWTLSSFTTVAEVRQQLELPEDQREYAIFDMKDDSFGAADGLHFHWKFQDKTGEKLLLEIVNEGEFKLYDMTQTLGVIANSPNYDWHLRNLEQYKFLEHDGIVPEEDDTLGAKYALGVPGDFKSPGRLVRALHWVRTCRPLKDALDAVRESFRILAGDDIPLGVISDKIFPGMISSTQFTGVADLTHGVYYIRTFLNHHIKKVDLSSIDWDNMKEPIAFLLDEDGLDTKEIYEDVTPSAPKVLAQVLQDATATRSSINSRRARLEAELAEIDEKLAVRRVVPN